MPTLRKPRQERAQLTVRSLLEATAQLLREGERLSTNRIARRAGVSIGSLYQYFENKEALVFALAMERREVLLQRLALLLTSDEDLDTRIDRAAVNLIEVLSEDPQLQVALTRQVMNGDLHQVLAELPRVAALVGRFIRQQGLPVEDPEMTGRILVTSMVGTVHTALLQDPSLLHEDSFRRGVVTMVRRTLGM